MMAGIISRLWSMSLQACILILIVLTVRFFLRKYPKAYTYFLWSLVGIRLLCPVFVEMPFSLQPETIRPDEIMQNNEVFIQRGFHISGQQPENQSVQSDIQGTEDLSFGMSSDVHTDENADIYDQSDFNLLPHDMSGGDTDAMDSGMDQKIPGLTSLESVEILKLLSVVYLAGVGIFLCFYLAQYIVMKRRISTAVRGKENVWFSERISSPFVIGILKPRIIMPYGLKKSEGFQILKHEQTHIRHCDPMIRLTGILCICLHWWNPLVWLAVFKMNQDMEMFCDETVLKNASQEEKKAYARTLLSFAEKQSSLSAGLAFGESHTERRVRNLARKRKGGIVITSLVIILTIFCVAAFLTIPGTRDEGADIGTDNSGSGNVEGNGAAGNTQNMSVAGNEIVTLTEEDREYLMDICPKIPDFSSKEEMNEDFWQDFLFRYYTSYFEGETVNRYVESLGFEIPYVKVSYNEVQSLVEQIFGSPLSEYVENPDSLVAEYHILFEEDFFYISESDSPDYKHEYVNDTDMESMRQVELLEGLNGEENYDYRIYMFLLPADNERGFRIDGKNRLPVLWDMESGMIKEQSFDVEFNPHGQVTFAAYAPNTELNPGEDVSFKLIQDGQIIYNFSESGNGRDKKIWKFQNVAAVAFPDLNGDGYTDVITLVNYQSGEDTLSEARIYTGRESRYFMEETILEEAYNNSHDQKTITDVENFVSQPEYQDYYVNTSIYGRWKVTEHIPSTGVYALSEEAMESLENTWLEYGLYWYKHGSDDPVTVDHYRKETITSSMFEEEFRISVSEMGISATEFDYYELEGVQDSASLFGQHFYQIDANNALIYYEGIFFRVVRE